MTTEPLRRRSSDALRRVLVESAQEVGLCERTECFCVRIDRRESSFGLFGVALRDASTEPDDDTRLLREGAADRLQRRVILDRHEITNLFEGSVGARQGCVRHFCRKL